MIYVSSSCIKGQNLEETVKTLQQNGFLNIELSSGIAFYDRIEDDLLDLKKAFGLRYLCHNYFASPTEDFVVNLASLDDRIYEKSLEHLKNVLRISKKIGAMKFGIHAGFFFDIDAGLLGKKMRIKYLYDRKKSQARFAAGFNVLRSMRDDVELYIENNVYSASTYMTKGGDNPFMLTNYASYEELRNKLDFKLLLDVAHLKVSSRYLGLDFNNELEKLMKVTDYVHISETNGMHDRNRSFNVNSNLLSRLKSCSLKEKTVTLEIYDDVEKIKESLNAVRGIFV